jgi:hypothetical protein
MTTLTAFRAVLMMFALVAPAAAQVPPCSIPQSPRNVDPKASPNPYNGTYSTSIVELTKDPDVLVYKPRPGITSQALFRCGQHYHFPIETPQGCKGEMPAKAEAGEKPKPGQWVEVHTVYAARVRSGGCDPETLDCCETPPFVVRAFSAKVTAGGVPEPIPPPTGRPLAEWSGSTTGAEKEPNECKPAAEWSFRLSCAFTVSEAQLKLFKHVDPARPVQPADRLSRDLTQVLP